MRAKERTTTGTQTRYIHHHQESMAGFVIQASGTVEFEDGLRMGVLPGDCCCHCGTALTLYYMGMGTLCPHM